jgi:hypothetical protein
MYQILEVDEEWNILKCTLYWRRVQKISITLAILVEFFVISLFHETKILWRSSCTLILAKIWKKMEFQAPWQMEDFIFPSVGYYTSILPKCQAHLQTSSYRNSKKNLKKFKGYETVRLTGPRPGALNSPFGKKNSSSYPQFLAHVVNSCWLAPAHACLNFS